MYQIVVVCDVPDCADCDADITVCVACIDGKSLNALDGTCTGNFHTSIRHLTCTHFAIQLACHR